MSNASDVNPFNYDVALSFLSRDEGLAAELSELLHNRFRVFMYTRQQESVAGTDGEKTLNSVFEAEARCVCVLYREEWGNTPFTRVEETAIRNRAYEEGYDFAIFIPLGNATPPRWLPRTRIWPNLERWGMNGLVAVVEKRILALGGLEQPETARDLAARLQRDIRRKGELRSFLYSWNGVRAAEAQLNQMISALGELVTGVSEEFPDLHLRFQGQQAEATVIGSGATLTVNWDSASNTLKGSNLTLTLYNNVARSANYWGSSHPEIARTLQFDFDRTPADELGWRDRENGRFFSTADLAERCLQLLLGQMRSTHFD